LRNENRLALVRSLAPRVLKFGASSLNLSLLPRFGIDA
jgi:hypothetical protein